MKVYDFILQGSDATEENAYNFAMGFDFSEVEINEESKAIHLQYIDTVDGIDIYYQYGADYYVFAKSE